ncbi:558_t:CDS:2, partial [Funneliformis caledonium]
ESASAKRVKRMSVSDDHNEVETDTKSISVSDDHTKLVTHNEVEKHILPHRENLSNKLLDQKRNILSPVMPKIQGRVFRLFSNVGGIKVIERIKPFNTTKILNLFSDDIDFVIARLNE